MSIKVELDQLGTEMASRPLGYLVTAGSEGAPHTGQADVRLVDGILVAGAGRTTRRHVAERVTVTFLWPPTEPGGFTLIVDGDAAIEGDGDDAEIHVTPTWAVLHRRAPAGDDDCAPLAG